MSLDKPQITINRGKKKQNKKTFGLGNGPLLIYDIGNVLANI